MKKLAFIFLILLQIANNIFAGNETTVLATKLNSLTASQISNGILIQDNKYGQNPVLFTNKTTEGRVTLKFDQAETNILASNSLNYKVKIDYDIIDIVHNGITSNIFNKSLEIENKASENVIIKDIDIVSFKNVSSFKVKIKAITINGVSYLNTNQNIPLNSSFADNIILEQQIITERYYNQPIITYNTLALWGLNNKLYNLNADQNPDEAEIYWNYFPGFEEYELEWVFVNNYSSDIATNLSEADVKFSFVNNSTKVRIKENFYTIPLIFDKGYIVYRVRGVSKIAANDNELFSEWSLPMESGSIFDIKGTMAFRSNVNYIETNPFEQEVNWQYIATYAEWGLNKAMVNFMDGTLRSRQNVTKNNSDKEVLVSETVYDYQGRPAVQILPAPVVKSASAENPISFYRRFNVSSSVIGSGTTQNLAFSKQDFDLDGSDICANDNPNSLHLDFGAGNYYSINNTNQTGFNAYLPEAFGYSYIQTEYTRDNTGKIRRKGNVGKDFQLGGRFTENLFGQPYQSQLNRLFGSVIGKKEHYQRNVVIDPNGQASISYLNLSGKVIASSLEGNHPDNLDPLDNNIALNAVEEELLSSNNEMAADYSTLGMQKNISVISKSKHEFLYRIEKIPEYKDDCMPANVCFECVYNLKLELRETDCNKEIFKLNENVGIKNDNLNYPNPPTGFYSKDYNFNNTPKLDLLKGSYRLSKELTIDESVLEEYANKYIDVSGTLPFNSCYTPDVSSVIGTRGCDYGCDKCLLDLGSSYADFKTKYTFPAQMEEEVIRKIYDNKKSECDELCHSKSKCDVIYQQMLDDVSPYGQYGDVFNKDLLKNDPSIHPLSVFTVNNGLPGNTNGAKSWKNPKRRGLDNHYYHENGELALVDVTNADPLLPYEGSAHNLSYFDHNTTDNGHLYIYPEQLLNVTDFLTYWKPSFAKELVGYHPEYCYYEWCINNTENIVANSSLPAGVTNSSNGFDDYLNGLTTSEDLTEVVTKLHSLGLLGSIESLMEADPFFNSTENEFINNEICENKAEMMGYPTPYGTSVPQFPPSLTRVSLMKELMINYKANEVFTGKNIAEIAWEANNCVTFNPNFYNPNNTPSPFFIPNYLTYNDALINPSSVITYINLYLDCKNRVKDIVADCYALNYTIPSTTTPPITFNSGFNECIGNQTFNSVYDGMIPELKPATFTDNIFGWLGNFTWTGITPTMFSNFWSDQNRGKPWTDNCQPCSFWNSFKFSDKLKRYSKASTLAKKNAGKSGEADPEMKKLQDKINYNKYLQTGQCPIDYALEVILNAKAKPNTGQSTGNLGVDITSGNLLTLYNQSFFPSLYDVLQGSGSTMDVINWKYTDITSNPEAWKFELKNTSQQNFTKYIKIFKPANLTSINVNQIVKIASLKFIKEYPTNIYQFTVYITVKNGSELKDYSCVGETDIEIGHCYSPAKQVCAFTEQAIDALKIAQLLTNVQSGFLKGLDPSCDLITNNININNNVIAQTCGTNHLVPNQFLSTCHPASFKLYFGDNISPLITSQQQYMQWAAKKYATYTELYLKRLYGSNYILLKITISNFVTENNHSYIYHNLKNTGTNSYSVFIKKIDNNNPFAVESDSQYDISFEFQNLTANNFANTDFPYEDCNLPEADMCSRQVYKNPEIVKNILNHLIKANKLETSALPTNDISLVPGPFWTDENKTAFAPVALVENLRWSGIASNPTSTTNQKLNGRIYYIIDNTTTPPTTIDLLTIELNITGSSLPPNYFSNTANTLKSISANPVTEGDETSDFVMFDDNLNIYSGSSYILKGNSNLIMKNCVICDPYPGSVNYKPVKICTFETTDVFETSVVEETFNTLPPGTRYKIISTEYFNLLNNYNNPYPCILKNNLNNPVMAYNTSNLTTNKVLWEHSFKYKPGKKYYFSADIAKCTETCTIKFKIINNSNQTSVTKEVILNSTSGDWNTYNFMDPNDPNIDFYITPATECISTFSNPCKLTFQIIAFEAQSGYIFLDNVKILEEYHCTPEPAVIKPIEPVPNPCEDYLKGLVNNNNMTQNLAKLEKLKNEFKTKYREQCLSKLKNDSYKETLNLTIERPGSEYQYTLYYYDQAGNLVQTVPPQGIKTLDLINNPLTSNEIIDNERTTPHANHNPALLPPHLMATTYQYNSLNQVMQQETPDAGITRFWYDEIGRVVLSQNAKQLPDRYSYTLYDNIGRIIEVGQIGIESIENAELQANLSSFIANAPSLVEHYKTTKTEITRTSYDVSPYGITSNGFVAENLRNRVASVAIFDKYQDLPNNYTHATHYSYDIHGNVNSLLQDNKYIYYIDNNNDQRFKLINYEYDLVSGKVNKVIYQPKGLVQNDADQFMHRYEYDADNRLTHVYTSDDGIIWEKDAKYFYYRHGPLARTEVGDLTVQGIDYAYTLQGWIKGINSNILNPLNDIGKDAMQNVANLHKNFANDLAAYSLKYYGEDYQPIAYNSTNTPNPITNANNFIANTNNITNLATVSPDLYNGNISQMVTTIMEASNSIKPQLTVYRYDQLNRIKQMKTFAGSSTNNAWSGSLSEKYAETYRYDANGNIAELTRNDENGILFDHLIYDYSGKSIEANNNITLWDLPNNRLTKLGQKYPSLPGMKPTSYNYDAIGNLTADEAENIERIEWNIYGKISKITKGYPDNNVIEFKYDAMGNRVAKIIKPAASLTNPQTWNYIFYTRDAQGNTMANYQMGFVAPIGNNLPAYHTTLTELDIYGSSRLGVKAANKLLDRQPDNPNRTYSRYLGLKRYEVSNHLGNVITIFTDRKIAQGTTLGSPISNYKAVLLASMDYTPFGMIMNGRNYNTDKYRFGFNGKENDNEVKGNGNQQDYGFRIYDPRIGKFLSVDPLTKQYPMLTPYQFASNCPISGIDLDGLEYFFKADGSYLGRLGKSQEVYTAEKIEKGVAVSASPLGINIKDFIDRTHFAYGEGGSTDVYALKDGTKVNPAKSFADAIQNAVDKFGSEETMKIKIWTKGSKVNYLKGNIQTEGNEKSPYNVFNKARIKFEKGDKNAFEDSDFKRNIAATINAIKDKNNPNDAVDGATNWCSGGVGDTWNEKMKGKDARDPTVKITNKTRWVENTTTFYKEGKTDGKKTDKTDGQ